MCGPKRNHHEHSERGKHHDEWRHPEDDLVGFRRNDVFFKKQLQGVRDRLQESVRPDAHRPQPHLHVRQDLALQPVHCNDRDRQPDKNQQDVDGSPEEIPRRAGSLVTFQIRLDVLNHTVHQRSTSPRTMSRVPITAITSATNWPRHINSSACRFTKLGGRTRTR